MEVLLSIDQGTTGTTVLALTEDLRVLGRTNIEFKQIYPRPGWVEHDPMEIWDSVVKASRTVINQLPSGARVDGIGITNQRETVVLWDRKTLEPVCNAIVWQDRRTAPDCERLRAAGHEKDIRRISGLLLDPYFSGTKVAWLLKNDSTLAKRAREGHIAFGTIDSWLIAKLTNGESHVTDYTNASRTLFFNIRKLAWDTDLLKLFKIPATILPEARPNVSDFGWTKGAGFVKDGTPITGVAGDQQSALFGQACFEVGAAKSTYGTGAFVLMNTGDKPIRSKSRMLTTVAWNLDGKKTTYALEGSAFIAGGAVQWIRDGLGLINAAREIEALANEVPDSGEVVFVPALSGLGAPHWNPDARGLICGITGGTTRAHIARATLEGIAFQVADLLTAMEADSKIKLKEIKVDGGACANNLLMQFQSDIVGRKVVRPEMIETTALGAAFLAGIGIGMWKDTSAVKKLWKQDKVFTPKFSARERNTRLERWHNAARRA
ncbi:MAG: glycerol kinase GlpK [Chrysiogenetes bacterium]|nr:glycerol kinase GlpK [Chrysiogenetes bacterium]